jgi:hypothetical protein
MCNCNCSECQSIRENEQSFFLNPEDKAVIELLWMDYIESRYQFPCMRGEKPHTMELAFEYGITFCKECGYVRH